MASFSDSPKYDIQLYQEAASENTSQQRLQELAKISTELARIIARNVNAAPELLSELSISTDKETRLGVVSNPNTPTDILWQLGKEFPDKLLENPVFSLLLLENPNLINEIPRKTMSSCAKVNMMYIVVLQGIKILLFTFCKNYLITLKSL